MLEITEIQPYVMEYYRRITLSSGAQIRVYNNHVAYLEWDVTERKTYSPFRNPIEIVRTLTRRLTLYPEEYLSDEQYLELVQKTLNQDPQAGLLKESP